MKLKVQASERSYSFQVTLIRNEELKLLYFAIELAEGAKMLVKKKFPGGEWVQLSGDHIEPDVANAIFDRIDHADFRKFLKNEKSLAEYNGI